MKRVFETAECEAVRNSIFWLQRYEKHDNQMKGCGVKLKVSDWQMNAWTSWACDTVKTGASKPRASKGGQMHFAS